MSRFKRSLSRAKFAAIGGALGAGVGGLLSRNAASTGAGLGALIGAVIGEKRVDLGVFVQKTKQKRTTTEE